MIVGDRALSDLDTRLLALPGRDMPASIGEAFSLARNELLAAANSDYYQRNRWQAAQDRIDLIHERTGEWLPNPENVQGPAYTAERERQYAAVRQGLDRLRQRFPDLDAGPLASEEAMHDAAIERARAAKAARADLASRPVSGSSALGVVAGSIAGGLGDPINVMAMALGAPAGAGILGTAAIEGAVNAAAQVAVELGTAKTNRQVDPNYGLADAAANVGTAAVGGAVLGGGAKALGRLIGALRGKGTREAADAANVLEAARHTERTNPLPDGVTGEAAHAAALKKAGDDIEAGRPVDVTEIVRPAYEGPEGPAGVGSGPDGGPSGGGPVAFDPRTLETDAATFQYKDGGDSAGVTDRLAGVTEWRPESSGSVLVYERADGTRVVADGHQRLGLAKRILAQGDGQEPRLYGWLYREADGWTPEQVRTIAAAKNMREGSGTALDAAKVLRDGDPAALRGLPTTSALIRDAKGLAELGPEAFGAVVNRVIPESWGAIVGRLVPEPGMQTEIVGLLKRLDPANRAEAESIVRQALEAGRAERAADAQGSLFGDAAVSESLYLERARVLDRALKQLRKDRAVFATLTAEEARIAGAGNVLDSAANLARVDADGAAVQTLATLANRKGPLSDALSEAARRARAEGSYDAAVKDFVEAVRAEAGRAQPADGALARAEAVRTPDGGPATGTALARPAAEIAGTAEHRGALDMEVNRLLASRDVTVTEIGPDGQPVRRSALDLLDAADREIEQAAGIATCVFGAAAE